MSYRPKWSQLLLLGATYGCGDSAPAPPPPAAANGASGAAGASAASGSAGVGGANAGSANGGGAPGPSGASPGGASGSASGAAGAGQAGGGGAGGSRQPWQPPAGELPVEQVLQAEPEVIASIPGSEHNEGPAYRDGNLFWCDTGGLFRLMQEQSLFLYVENDTCGAAFAAADGSLLLAFGQSGVARISASKAVEQLAALPMGGFANDITLDAAGNIYVSNIGRGEVLRVTPGGTASVVAQNLPGANGLEVDPENEFLYVNQSSENRVVRLALGPGNQLGEAQLFADEVDAPDGAAFDAWGNYWVTEFTSERIRIFSPQGMELGVLDSGGEATTNLTFGGPALDVLYVTGGGTLRKIAVGAPGFPGHAAAPSYTALGPLPFVVTDTPQ